MVALVKGQNAPLTAERIAVTVEVAGSADLSALLLTATGKVRSDADFAFYNQPRTDGVIWQRSGTSQRLDLDLTAVPRNIERVLAAVSLDETTFGAITAPIARLITANGTVLASFDMFGLSEERAVIAFEVYRRANTWKVRAVGQGYTGGLAELIMAYGVAVEDAPAASPPVASFTQQPVPPPQQSMPPQRPAPRPAYTPPTYTPPAPPVPMAPPAVPEPEPPVSSPPERQWASSVPPATIPEMTIRPPSVPLDSLPVPPMPTPGVIDDERMYEDLWKIFEDAARATAALRSATGYADQRRDNELSQLLDDPRARNSPQTERARGEAERRHDELVARATTDFKRDVSALVAELAQISTSLPAPMASWDSPSWNSWRPQDEPTVAIRLGDLHVEEAPELRIPLVFRLPMRIPLWIDSGDGKRGEATALARALVVRLLAAYPPGQMKVHVADLVGGGAAAKALQPLNAGVVYPPATTPAELSEMLGRLTERVDLLQMAAQADALDTLEGKIDKARQLLVLHDFPYGFDDRAVAQLRFLIEDGPAAGVHLLFVADPSDANTLGPLVSALWRSMHRLSATPDDGLGDPWVGLSWTYTPDAVSGAQTLDSVLTRLADRTIRPI